MSPPIRDGSGSSIGSIRLGDGSEIAEVRTGAGDVLFSAAPPIPDSAVAQFTASDFDETNDEWVDAIDGSVATNSGSGSASKTTDPDGNTSVKFSGSEYYYSSDSVSSPNSFVVNVVFSAVTSGTQASGSLWADSGRYNYVVVDPSQYADSWGSGTAQSGGSPDKNIHLLTSFGDTGTSQIDDSQIIDNSNSGYLPNGLFIGSNYTDQAPYNGHINEIVIYSNPSSSELDSEKKRLRDKYSGLSFTV